MVRGFGSDERRPRPAPVLGGEDGDSDDGPDGSRVDENAVDVIDVLGEVRADVTVGTVERDVAAARGPAACDATDPGTATVAPALVDAPVVDPPNEDTAVAEERDHGTARAGPAVTIPNAAAAASVATRAHR